MSDFLNWTRNFFRHFIQPDKNQDPLFFEELLAATPDAIYFKDRKNRFVQASNQLAKRLGVKNASELIGKTDYDFFMEEHARKAFEDEQHIIATGEPLIDVEEKENFPDGRELWVSTSKIPLKDYAGNIIGTMGISRDITDRKKAELELIKAKEEALAAAKAKTQFLSTMSHEIRTPLNAVIGLSGVLSETKLTSEQYEFVRTINHSGENLLSIINNILDFAKIDSGKLDLEETEFSIASLIEDVLGIVSATKVASKKNIEFVYHIEEAVPDYISSDSTRIQQILVNLVNNAIKFTDEGEIVIYVRNLNEQQNSITLEFSVKDSGIGIPEDKMDRLFEQFTQVDSSTTRKYGGTGLGLAISRRLVDLLGGKISVQSEEGKGTVFTFTIKVKKSGRKLQASPPNILEGKKVFILDDNDTNLKILEMQCNKAGMEVKTYQDARRFVSKLDEMSDFDFGILDMQMPYIDGLEVSIEIRKRWDKNELPLVLLSSISEITDVKQNNLINLYLTKPIQQTLLLNNLERIFENRDTTLQSREKDDIDKYNLNRSIKILVAEDNQINQMVAGTMLKRLGYSYEMAANGVETVKMCKEIPFDLVLMDVLMPEMDGLQATKELIRQKDELPKLPLIIAMTANAMKEEADQCLDAGMKDFMSKPVTLPKLQEILYKWFPLKNN